MCKLCNVFVHRKSVRKKCASIVQILCIFCAENVSFLLHVFAIFKNVTKMRNICYIFCTLFARFFNNSLFFFVQIMRIFCANN